MDDEARALLSLDQDAARGRHRLLDEPAALVRVSMRLDF
jgi:hypothetical protein